MPKGDRLRLKADPEDGTTPIANLLLEAVAMAKLSGLQKGAILYLLMKSKGNCIDFVMITLSEWAKVLDSSRSRVSHTLKELQDYNIIQRHTSGHWQPYRYKVNTELTSWHNTILNLPLLSGQGRLCSRCGSDNNVETHHIKERAEGGGDEPSNKQPLCNACHNYEHARRNILKSLEKAQRLKQPKRVIVFQNRLHIIDKLNTLKLIKQRTTYQTWWTEDSLHHLPRYEKVRLPNVAQSEMDIALLPQESTNG